VGVLEFLTDLLALPITLLALFALGILLIDLMIPPGDEVGQRGHCLHRRAFPPLRAWQNSALDAGTPHAAMGSSA
jgi:hypothetical protein